MAAANFWGIKPQVEVLKEKVAAMAHDDLARLADEDFAWKDFKAAENAGMPVPDYVIGGMDREFKQKLFHLLRAADDAGLSPGITSAFRDDYRQSIASGLKAANDRSYHGGSSRGGYGHGLAADIVGVKGATRAERLASSQVMCPFPRVTDRSRSSSVSRASRSSGVSQLACLGRSVRKKSTRIPSTTAGMPQVM